jgi:hypothetical protein
LAFSEKFFLIGTEMRGSPTGINSLLCGGKASGTEITVDCPSLSTHEIDEWLDEGLAALERTDLVGIHLDATSGIQKFTNADLIDNSLRNVDPIPH